MNSSLSSVCAALTFGLVYAQAQQPAKYEFIEVNRFEVQSGLDIPDVFLNSLEEDLIQQLRRTKRFREVLRSGIAATDTNAPVVRLVGTLQEFQPGSRMARYMVPGLGKTRLQAHMKLLDRSSGEVLLERDVDGKVFMGLFGGDSLGATRGLAKEVAKATKNRLF
jgi:TolB-like protein